MRTAIRSSRAPSVSVARLPLAAFIAFAVLALAPAASAETRNFTVSVQNKRVDIGSGLTYDAWTYGGTVPGPLMRVREGDLVNIHLVNDADVAHGIDIHAASIAPNLHFTPIPGKTDLHYSFVADVPGVYMYHCSSPPIVTHIANGMYGMFIVDPAKGWGAKAQEVTIVQGEFYGDPDANGLVAGDSKRMMDERPDLVVFNGQVDKYVEHPIPIKVDQPVRVFFVNAGPNRTSTFHIIGAMLDIAYKSGNISNPAYGLQSFEVGPGNGAAFEFKVHEAGDYPFTDHAIARAYKGAFGVFHATAK